MDRHRCAEYGPILCYPQKEFIVGDNDVLLDHIGGAPVYINASQFEAWKHRPHHRCRSRPRWDVFPREWPRSAIPDRVTDMFARLESTPVVFVTFWRTMSAVAALVGFARVTE